MAPSPATKGAALSPVARSASADDDDDFRPTDYVRIATPKADEAHLIGVSPTRKRTRKAIAATYFGPSSQATSMGWSGVEGDVSTDDEDESQTRYRAASDATPETPHTRRRRKENEQLFADIAHLADLHQPVTIDAFRRQPSGMDDAANEPLDDTSDDQKTTTRRRRATTGGDHAAKELNLELMEAYVAYARSIGHEPQIELSKPGESDIDDDDEFPERASYIQERQALPELPHWWTDKIGTRYSKRRGCVQFWSWMAVGVVVSVIFGFFLAHLSENEVLHLDAFTDQNYVITSDYQYLLIRDEVSFHLTYSIQSQAATAGENASDTYFQVLLLNEEEFENYVEGEEFEYIEVASTLRTTYASKTDVYVDNEEQEGMYLVIQPCILHGNYSLDYCQTSHLPTHVHSNEKIYSKHKKKTTSTGLHVQSLYVNPMPNDCKNSGDKGSGYLLLFVPYVLVTLFALRVPQMLWHRENFRENLERQYRNEFLIPENEVDYWQPMPWDRKVPKTRLLGPCCWKKMRRPFEPFYTWWRHENYFTWVFFPYRNERLSRGERVIIVVSSLYITFYVTFLLVMLHSALDGGLTVFTNMVMYYFLLMIMPSLGKAIFKEIFKLIFRQRRKFFRLKATGGDMSGFSFRMAFFLQVLVVVCTTLAQLPMVYIWLYRSCEFLKQFMYFGILAAVTRLSLLGLLMDYIWYLVIKTWGWRDLCPYCTERMARCDCFNDELLVLSVERVGPKWELIIILDKALAKAKHYDPQFELYTPEQLHERWLVLVDRARAHMTKMEKLAAYRAKKEQDRLRRLRRRESVASFLGLGSTINRQRTDSTMRQTLMTSESVDPTSQRRHAEDFFDDEHEISEFENEKVCSLREHKILALNDQITLDKFEKHYDSTIGDVFSSLQRALSRRRRHGRKKSGSTEGTEDTESPGRDDSLRRRENENGTTAEIRQGAGSGGQEGESMWIYDTPAQRIERRQLEKKHRKRVFKVLKDYEIETVQPQEDGHGHVQYIMAPPAEGPSSTHSMRRGDSKLNLFMQRNRSNPTEDDVVVLASDAIEPRSSSSRRTNSRAAHDATFDDIAITIPEILESDGENEEIDRVGELRGDRESLHSRVSIELPDESEPLTTRTYAVVERPKTLFRKMSMTAGALASWAMGNNED